MLPIADALLWGPTEALHQENPQDLICVLKFLHRYYTNFSMSYCDGWRVGPVWCGVVECGAYLPLKFLGVQNLVLKIVYFLDVFSHWGEQFLQIFRYQQGKNRARRPKMDPKIDTFGQVDIRVFILGIENIVFWTFSNLFWSCLGSVRELFSTLKGLLSGVFSARNIDK